MTDLNLFAALLMGLAGSTHCVAMCGSVAGSLQLASKDLNSLGVASAYNIGRMLSYSFAGALVGGISSVFAKQSNEFSLFLSLFSGVFMMLVGLYIMRLFNALAPIERAGNWALWQHLVRFNRHLLPVNTYPKALFYGALWGWLPCGLVYSALTWAITSQSALNGALFMAAFALGTLPAMLALGLGAHSLKHILNYVWVRLILGNLLLWYGLFSVLVASHQILT